MTGFFAAWFDRIWNAEEIRNAEASNMTREEYRRQSKAFSDNLDAVFNDPDRVNALQAGLRGAFQKQAEDHANWLQTPAGRQWSDNQQQLHVRDQQQQVEAQIRQLRSQLKYAPTAAKFAIIESELRQLGA